MRLITLLTLLLLATFAPAFATPFDDGMAAYKSGDWAKAFEILKPLAALDNSQSTVVQLRLAGKITPAQVAQADKLVAEFKPAARR